MGNRISIKARSHNPLLGTTKSEKRPVNLRIEADITIGNYCWIGDNVFIDKGVTIGDHCIIGANTVVVKDIPSFSCAGGVPARVLYDRRERGFIPPDAEE
jgi:maltose O-acetyltransferase